MGQTLPGAVLGAQRRPVFLSKPIAYRSSRKARLLRSSLPYSAAPTIVTVTPMATIGTMTPVHKFRACTFFLHLIENLFDKSL